MKIFAMLVTMFFGFVFGVQASTDQVTGWQVNKTHGDQVMEVVIKGNTGGVLTLGCRNPGETVKVKYHNLQSIDDLFVIEIPGIKESEPYVAVYGLNSLSPIRAASHLERAKVGFMVSYYPVGSIKQFFARKTNNSIPVPTPVGSEEFIGSDKITQYAKDILSVCSGSKNAPVI